MEQAGKGYAQMTTEGQKPNGIPWGWYFTVNAIAALYLVVVLSDDVTTRIWAASGLVFMILVVRAAER